MKKAKEREVYLQLYEAMEALVHICRDGCKTIGPRDKVLNEHQEPCKYEPCKGLESLIRHFAGCKLRVPGGCVHCKRMWQLLELHSRLCIDPNVCKVPLCKYGSMIYNHTTLSCNYTMQTLNTSISPLLYNEYYNIRKCHTSSCDKFKFTCDKRVLTSTF